MATFKISYRLYYADNIVYESVYICSAQNEQQACVSLSNYCAENMRNRYNYTGIGMNIIR